MQRTMRPQACSDRGMMEHVIPSQRISNAAFEIDILEVNQVVGHCLQSAEYQIVDAAKDIIRVRRVHS